MVAVTPSSSRHTRRVAKDQVHSVVCNRVKDGDEQYLVRWHTEKKDSYPPLSWHLVNELTQCLEHVQDYLEEREKLRKTSSYNPASSRKRKSPETTSYADLDTYNCTLVLAKNGVVSCRSATGPGVVSASIADVLTPELKLAAYQSEVRTANTLIRYEYVRRLKKVPGHPIKLINLHDASTPSLRFQYIPRYVLGEGVQQYPPETATGCQQCSPRMGRDIGCEYPKKCDCLEYAAVDEARLNHQEQEYYERCKAEGLPTMGLPKRFPYFVEGTKVQRAGALVSFYLDSRRPIYECNDNCRCGPNCRNKNVQFGRKVEVEIFRTAGGRGWGLRCTEDLQQGQFIDTYRGEVITDQEATRREQISSKAKASYLYSLDKFQDSEELNREPYVVDGEFMGGPTKFMNHSCEPNCRQYTVSYNKNDPYVYDIAFFACRDIPAFEELTFDYLDKEEGEEMDDPGEDAIPCLCGAAKCRKWLWT